MEIARQVAQRSPCLRVSVVRCSQESVASSPQAITVLLRGCPTAWRRAASKRVIYAREYPDELARNFLAEAGVEMVRFLTP